MIAEYFAALKINTKGALKSIDTVDKRANTLSDRFKRIGGNLQASLNKIRLPATVVAGAGLTLGKGLIKAIERQTGVKIL